MNMRQGADEARWCDGPFVGFDTETTGVDTAKDRIVTAAVVIRGEDGVPETRTWLINPGVDIPAAATAVHGVTTAQARAEGVSPCDGLEEIAAVLAEHLQRGTPLVVFNAGFDIPLLEAELARHGLPTLAERLGGPVMPVIDPLVIDRWQDRFRRGGRRLGNLVDHYGVTVDSHGLHNAEADVLAMLDVLHAQLRRWPNVAAMPLELLHAEQARAHRDWAVGFNEWLARKGKVADVNPEWLSYPT